MTAKISIRSARKGDAWAISTLNNRFADQALMLRGSRDFEDYRAAIDSALASAARSP